jgi:hypothetical protein
VGLLCLLWLCLLWLCLLLLCAGAALLLLLCAGAALLLLCAGAAALPQHTISPPSVRNTEYCPPPAIYTMRARADAAPAAPTLDAPTLALLVVLVVLLVLLMPSVSACGVTAAHSAGVLHGCMRVGCNPCPVLPVLLSVLHSVLLSVLLCCCLGPKRSLMSCGHWAREC